MRRGEKRKEQKTSREDRKGKESREKDRRGAERRAEERVSSSCRGSGACMSASWLCERRHNYCVYKAELLLLLNYWGGGA